MSKRQMRQLIETIYMWGDCTPEGHAAIKQLAQFGEPAVEALLDAFKHPPPTPKDRDGRDFHALLGSVFGAFARTVPDKLIDLMETGRLTKYEVYWALGGAKGRRSLDVLIAGLKDKCKFARWMAAHSLVERRSRRAVPALIEALRDRDGLVRTTVVSAMQSNQMYRRPEALPLLQRIVDSKFIQRRSPGLWKNAQEVIELIEKEQGQ